MLTTIIIFILILGLLIFVHEFGHFVAAKRAGIKVEEFALGFPPRIFGVKKGETIYSLNLLPIGGFVKIYGEEGKPTDKQLSEGHDEGRAFYDKPIRTRAVILIAGVAMNLLLAAFLLSAGYWLGLPSVVDDQAAELEEAKIQITQVAFDSPASRAGIKIGDTITKFKTVEEVQKFVDEHKGQEITMTIQRGDEALEKTLVPRVNHPENEGPLGIALARTAIVSYPWYRALIMGLTSTVSLVWLIITALGGLLWQLITTGRLAIEIAGPVGIFNLTGQATQLGFIYLLQLTALISINLAVINILPFPALDGGRLLFLAIEKIKGSPVSQKIERFANTAGFVILILLMIVVTWRDIVRIF